MRHESSRKMNKTMIGFLVIMLTVLYLSATVALAQTSPKSSTNTSYSYTADPLSWGDVYSFDNAAFNGTNYSKVSGSTTDKTYYNGSTQSNSGAGTWAMPAYVGAVTFGNHAAPTNVTAMTSHTVDQFRSSISFGTVVSPVNSSVTIPVSTTTGTGIYSIVPGSTGGYVVYVYSPSGTPSNVKYTLIDSYSDANNYSGTPATALTFTQVGSTDWYYSSSISIDTLGWYCLKPNVTQSSSTRNSGDTGTGSFSGNILTNTTLNITNYYHNTWSTEQVKFDTVLCLSFPSSVSLGPITKADGTFSLTNDNTKGTVSVQNIFGENVGTSYNGVHIPLFISATPASDAYSFTGVDGGSVTVVADGLYRYDFEGTASLASKWEQMVDLPTVTVGTTTLDAYFNPNGTASFQNGTDTMFTFTADFSEAASGATLTYTVSGSTTGIDTSGTLTAGDNSFSLVASFDTVTVTFTATGDGVTKTMTYTITGSDAGLTKVARIGTTSGSNEYYRLEDALLASNNGTSGNIYMIADYTMYSGNHPRTTWLATTGSNQKGYFVKSGVTLVVPYSTSTTVHTTSPATIAAATISHYRTLTVPGNVAITVAGAVSVDSQVNQANGMSTGPHGLIVMQAGSTMTFNSGAYLYCWGYINGDGEISMLSGSTVYECFKLGNWRGGNCTSNMLNNDQKVFPINQYFVQNVEAPMKIYAGASEKVFTCVTVSILGTQTSTADFIGSSSGMFRISSGYVTKRYLPTTDHLLIEAHGSVSLSSITIKVSSYSMNSASYVLPITNNLDITVADGAAVTAAQDLAFLAGSVLTIDDGGKFIIPSGNNVYIYDQDEWNLGNFATQSAKMVVVGYSTANGTTTMRTADSLGDAVIDVNGTLEINGKLFTTVSGADITSSQGTGEVQFKAATTNTTTTYQATQNDTAWTAVAISCTTAKLHNGDGSYSQTTSAQNGWTFYYDKDYEHWYRYRVNYSYDGNIVYKSHYCIDADLPFSYTVDGMASVSATTDGNSTVSVSGTTVSVTGVTGNSTVTIAGTPYTYIPVFVLNETQYSLYQGYTGNTLVDTRTIGGSTYHVVQAAGSAMNFGSTLAAPTDAAMGIVATNHNSIAWKLSDSASGNAFLGSVPSGTSDGAEVYIYGIYSGFVAWNSFTDEYYTTLYEAMSYVPQSGTTIVRLLADCGSFEAEDATANYTIYSAANVTLDLNGHSGVGRITNSGNMTITDTSANGGGSLTSAQCNTSSTLTNYGYVVRNNATGTLTITNVTLTETQDGNAYNCVIFNYNGGSIPTISNVTMNSLRGYALWNYGGSVGTIDNCIVNTAYGINNRNIRGSNAISAGYNISAYGSINTISNSTFTVGQYAVYNGGTIGTLSDSIFMAAPDSAQVNTIGAASANVQGNVQCYTIFNSNVWWYDTSVWKRTDVSSGSYTRTDYYQEGEQYRPTITNIIDCTIVAENTSTNADHGCALYNNGGVIETIGGGSIQTYKHSANASNIASNYALRNTAGGIITSISGVTISATGSSAVYNDGQFTAQTYNKYSDKIGGIQLQNITTYGDASTIGSISGCAISAGVQYGIYTDGYIGSISGGGISANFNALLNSSAGAVSSYQFDRTYTTNTDSTTETKREETYVRNLETGGVINSISGVSFIGSGSNSYYLLQNQGYIGTLSNSSFSAATPRAGESYAMILNGDSRQSGYTLTREPYAYDALYITPYKYHYDYDVTTINVIDNVTITKNATYAFRNLGRINTLRNSTITGTQYVLLNVTTGPYIERDYVRYYSGTTKFATTKNNGSNLTYYYRRIPSEIGAMDNNTITGASTYTLYNGGHLGTLTNNTISSSDTTVLYNGGACVREYDYNLLDIVSVSATSSACTVTYGANSETRVIATDYDEPVIDLIGPGNTISGTYQVVANLGTITAINGGDSPSSITSTTQKQIGGIYNYTGTLDQRVATTPYTAGTAGTTTNTDTYLNANIGAIKNTYIQAAGYGIKNGSANSAYLPTIGELGDGLEVYACCTTAGYHAVWSTTYAKIAGITGGLYKTTKGSTTYAYKNDSTDSSLATTISAGDFLGMANTRANAIYEPDNINRQTYPSGYSLSTTTETPSYTNSNMSGSYYFITRSYTITWMNGSTQLGTTEVAENATLAYSGTTPTKASTAQYTYTFDGWSLTDGGVKLTTIPAATANATYYAHYSQSIRSYTITWADIDGAGGSTTTSVAYDGMPSYSGTPSKASTDQYEYSFSGWSPAIASVTGDATYTAQFTQSTRSYTVTFVANGGGGSMGTQSIPYGTPTALNPNTFTAPGGYGFNGWNTVQSPTAQNPGTSYTDGADITVTGDVTLYAQWAAMYNYTITWGNLSSFSYTAPSYEWDSESMSYVQTNAATAGWSSSGSPYVTLTNNSTTLPVHGALTFTKDSAITTWVPGMSYYSNSTMTTTANSYADVAAGSVWTVYMKPTGTPDASWSGTKTIGAVRMTVSAVE